MRTTTAGFACLCVLLTGCNDPISSVSDDAVLISAADAPTNSGAVTRSIVLSGYLVNDLDSGVAALINFDRNLYCQGLEHRQPHEQMRVDHEDGQATIKRDMEDALLVVFNGNPNRNEVLDCNVVLPPILGTGSTDLHQVRQLGSLSPDGPARAEGVSFAANGAIGTVAGMQVVRVRRQFTWTDPDGDDVLVRHGSTRISFGRVN